MGSSPLYKPGLQNLIQEESRKGITSTIAAFVGSFYANTFLNADKGRVNQNVECTFCKKKGILLSVASQKDLTFVK